MGRSKRARAADPTAHLASRCARAASIRHFHLFSCSFTQKMTSSGVADLIDDEAPTNCSPEELVEIRKRESEATDGNEAGHQKPRRDGFAVAIKAEPSTEAAAIRHDNEVIVMEKSPGFKEEQQTSGDAEVQVVGTVPRVDVSHATALFQGALVERSQGVLFELLLCL